MKRKSIFLMVSLATLYFQNFYAQQSETDSTKSENIDEIVVTGVFDKRMKMNSPMAITVLKGEIIEKKVPVSAADLLRNVPGVYVNSANGEIRNSVSSRGITIGTQDGSFGYEYVSMQEDGLPITNTTYFNYGPDFFLRADATIDHLDAVRGGSSSITTANAPGGIFNYVSKTGGNKFAGELRFRTGLQGDNGSGLYKTDLNFGGPLGNNWFYNLGGFYRYDLGARNPGDYALNNGGQVKFNVVKKYQQGSVKIFLKYLNDKNGYSMSLPTRGFTDPKIAEGFDNSSSVLLPELNYVQQNFVEGGTMNYNSSNLVHSKYRSIGVNWDHKLGEGWALDNKFRYSNNDVIYNTSSYSSIISATSTALYNLVGATGYGNYTFRDVNTGQVMLSVNATAPSTGSTPIYTVNQNNLTNQSLGANSVFVTPLNLYENKVEEILEQFTINKKWRNMNFSLGGYYGYSDVARVSGGGGVAFTTLEPRPSILTVDFNGSIGGVSGNYQVTNADGVAQFPGNSGVLLGFYAKQRQFAGFFGHTWDITPALTLDWGIRYENGNMKGHNTRTYLKVTGGLDNNRFTLYDNTVLDYAQTVDYDRTLETFAYSAALNYRLNTNLAVYGRYSHGNKAPDLDVYFATNRVTTIQFLDPQKRVTDQLEAGIKAKYESFDLFVTPFYSVLKNVPAGGFASMPDGSFYALPTIYNDFKTYGVEIETNVRPLQNFNVRAVATLQKSEITNGTFWITNAAGPTDDVQGDFSGNETSATPRLFFNVTPMYSKNKFYTFITWNYMGERQANNRNTFKLPSFSLFDFAAGYNFSERISASFNINNLFDKYAVMSWLRPGSYAEQRGTLDSFTPEAYQSAEASDQPYFTIANPPRSYFLTLSYKF